MRAKGSAGGVWLLLLVGLSVAPRGGGAVDTCPAAGISTGSCLVVGGADILAPPQNLSRTQCCAACAASANKPPAKRCSAFQWNYAGNSWGEQVWNANHTTRGAKCFDPSVTCCLLFAGPTKKKQPVHPAQEQCDTGTMPLPPAPPWPASPPAGAKNVLYVLVDDLRTQMTPYGHGEMKTPHFAAFADTAVLFEQAHCNSQMCVPTRNR
jgi:hypothetical protein